MVRIALALDVAYDNEASEITMVYRCDHEEALRDQSSILDLRS